MAKANTIENFCILPWIHLYKHTDDNVKLCCVDYGETLGSLKDNTLDEIRNGEKFKEIRRAFLNNEKPERCKQCWSHESNGITSFRQSQRHYYESQNYHEWEFDENPMDVLYMDYRANNTCNLGCKTCNPEYSSRLISPHKELGYISQDDVLKFTRFAKSNIKFSEIEKILETVKHIYFAGGEPMITEEHWYILDKLIQENRTHVSLYYNTNLTTLRYKGKHIHEYWRHFAGKSDVTVSASIDGFGDVFEYMRSGAKWYDIRNNLMVISKMEKITLQLSPTIGWLNLTSVIDLHKFVLDNEIIKDITLFNLNPMYGMGASLSDTPIEIKDELLDHIYDYQKWIIENSGGRDVSTLINQLEGCNNMVLNSSPNEHDFNFWIKRNKVLDKTFGLDINKCLNFKNNDLREKILDRYANL